MAYLAQLDNNNIVLQVLSVSNNDCPDPAPDNEAQGASYLQSIGFTGIWKQTSYNGRFRKNFAGVDYKYDTERDAFIPPKPFESWILNEDTCIWDSPVPYPTDGKYYIWNEETISWIEVA